MSCITVPLYRFAAGYSVYLLTVLKIRRLIKGVRLLFSSVLLAMVIAFAETKQASKVCRRITITIANGLEHKFVEKKTLLEQITANATTPIINTPSQVLETRSIGRVIKAHHFVREVTA